MSAPLTISFSKGEALPLTVGFSKDGAQLTEVEFGAGWDIQTDNEEAKFDNDLVVTRLTQTPAGLIVTDVDDMIFFNHPNAVKALAEAQARGEDVSDHRPPFWTLDESVWHSGDNLTGEGEGRDEYVRVLLDKQPERVAEIEIGVNIDQGVTRGQNFGQIDNCFFDASGPAAAAVARFDLTRKATNKTFKLLAKAYRENGGWTVKGLDTGYDGGIKEYLETRNVALTNYTA